MANGAEIMGPNVMLWHYPNNDIMNQSLLTVESNHFCVLKSRGAILNVYETGQYPVETPQEKALGVTPANWSEGDALELEALAARVESSVRSRAEFLRMPGW